MDIRVDLLMRLVWFFTDSPFKISCDILVSQDYIKKINIDG